MPATPLTWRNRQTVNAAVGDSEVAPDIVQLANGNILVSWSTNGDAAPADGELTSVLGQLFDPLGGKIGGNFRLNNVSTLDNEQEGQLAPLPLPDGGFVVAYHDIDSGGGPGSNIRLEEFDANGVPASADPTVVFDTANNANPNYSSPRVAVSSASSALIVYREINGGVGEIKGKIYNPVIDAYSGPIDIILGVNQSDPDVTALTNGNYVVAATRTNTVTGDSSLSYRILDSAGGNVRGVTEVAGTSGNAQADVESSVTALAGGGFVIAWTNIASDTDVFINVYDADGAEVALSAVGGGSVTNNNNEPVVAALADGSFVVIYDNDELDRLDVQHFGATGAPLGSSFNFSGPGSTMSATGLRDGRFAVTWFDGVTNEISLEILDTRDAPNSPTSNGWVVGTVGNDAFTPGSGALITHGWVGNDTITENSNERQYFGDSGNDTLRVTTTINHDLHDGGAGIDTIDWSASAEVGATYSLAAGTASAADGGPVEQMRGFENFIGTANVDIVFGTSGANILRGGGGNDSLGGGAGNDILIGGSGVDTANYATAAAGVIVSLALSGPQNTGAAGTDTVSEIENLTGSGLNDSLTGNAFANALSGGGGNDALAGGDGNDTLSGGLGNDSLNGGAGNDTADFSFAAGPITVDLKLTGAQNTGQGFDILSGIENLIGSAFGDTLTGNAPNNRIDGAGGNDTLKGNAAHDTLFGGAGNDLLYGEAGNDTLDAGAGIDRLYDGAGNDTVFGGADADQLFAGPAIDRLDGGDGNDRLYAHAASADTFVFASAIGIDRVFNFLTGFHNLEIDASVFGGAAGGFVFRAGSNPVAPSATRALLYDTDDGKLWFDADGNGAGLRVHVLTLFGAPTLAAGDIVLV